MHIITQPVSCRTESLFSITCGYRGDNIPGQWNDLADTDIITTNGVSPRGVVEFSPANFNSPSLTEVILEYSINNGTDWRTIDTVENTGSYSWTVPYLASKYCLVRVSDANDLSSNDISDATFQIIPSSPALLYPNGEEVLVSGSKVPVQWSTEGTIGDISIEYSIDNSFTWEKVTPPNKGNTGTYLWTVPDEISRECIVKVSDLKHPDINDISNDVFEIASLDKPEGKMQLIIIVGVIIVVVMLTIILIRQSKSNKTDSND